MKHQTKKITGMILSIMLALLGGLFIFCTNAYAKTTQRTYGDWKYTISSNNEITITWLEDSNTKKNIVIPSTINGYPVTKIGKNTFFKHTEIKTVKIPKGVVSIGESAFYQCQKLKSVEIPESVKEINAYAFYQCTGLKKIKLPKSLEKIGKETFGSCIRLKTVTIPKNVSKIAANAFDESGLKAVNVAKKNKTYSSKDGVLFNKAKTKLLYFPKNKKGTYNVPTSVKTISANSFMECDELKKVIISGGVTKIGKNSFVECKNLKSVELSESVKTVGKNAFSNCEKLKIVTIKNSMMSIGEGAFLCAGRYSQDGTLIDQHIVTIQAAIDSTAYEYVQKNPLNFIQIIN